MSETAIVKAVQLEATKKGYRVFRNNVGRLQAKSGAWVQFGLCPGSSDLIGWKTMVVTPDMVGMPVAVFTAIEVKTPTGAFREGQEEFLETVRNSGGIGILARSEKDLCK